MEKLTNTTKRVIIVIMIIQVFLILIGIWELLQGEWAFGLFDIILNSIFFIVNLYSLKMLNE